MLLLPSGGKGNRSLKETNWDRGNGGGVFRALYTGYDSWTLCSRRPNPSAIKDSTKVFRLTPSYLARAASLACSDFGRR